jgi:hypothetical protein
MISVTAPQHARNFYAKRPCEALESHTQENVHVLDGLQYSTGFSVALQTNTLLI